MGINKRQWLFNQIVAADPTKNTEDTLNGDVEETYHSMLNAGAILPTGLVTSVSPMARTPNSTNARQIKGYDPVDKIAWYVSSADFVTSSDHGVTASANLPLPTNVSYSSVYKVLRAGGYVWLGGKDSSDNFTKIWRAPVITGGGNYVWSSPLLTLSTNASLLITGMSADNQYIYVGDYADPTPAPKVYRAPLDSGTFSVVTPSGIVRHVHCIAPDPYRPGNVWMTTGDSGARIYRSTDYGATWTLLDSSWQAVQISFSKEWVWFSADSAVSSVFVMNRDALIPTAATPSFHYEIAVPGGAGGRTVTDLATTANSATVTSATANFTQGDVGRLIYPTNHGSQDIYITAVASATSATMSINHYATATGVTAYIDGDRFYDKAFFGAVDPNTGLYYCIANDNSGKGTRSGLFVLPKIGQPLVLVEAFLTQITGQMFINDGYLHAHQVVRPVFSVAPNTR